MKMVSLQFKISSLPNFLAVRFICDTLVTVLMSLNSEFEKLLLLQVHSILTVNFFRQQGYKWSTFSLLHIL